MTPTSPPTQPPLNWYYWGANGGRGGGSEDDETVPFEYQDEIRDISAGSRHSFLVRTDGKALSVGYIQSESGYKGHLGLGPVKNEDDCKKSTEEFCVAAAGDMSPLIIEKVVNAKGKLVDAPDFQQAFGGVGVEADSGGMHTVLISRDRRVYISGYNNKGQLCLGKDPSDEEFVNYFHEVPGIDNAKAAAVGNEFTLIMTHDGEVYGCGSNADGRIGQGNEEFSDTPALIEGMGEIDDMSAGLGFAIFLDKSKGEVWGTGSNIYGQLCSFTEGTSTGEAEEIKIEDSDKIVQVQSSRESSYYLFESGEVLACGRNNEGQLGNNSEDRLNTNSDEPIVKVELEDEVRSIHSGPSSYSAFFVGEETVWGVGMNDRYQLGIDKLGSAVAPVETEFDGPINIIHLSSSGSHTVAMGNYLGSDDEESEEKGGEDEEGGGDEEGGDEEGAELGGGG